ncbi:DNA-directed RNA polymerase subunit H [Candidatus Pacearchaeota archaeon]|nr:DNA-directed RNA polymerase subunit H [Candidatus Pacearchaeota archaeon]
MHILQPKHSKLRPEEADKLLSKLNVVSSQLPKIKSDDPSLPTGCKIGDIVRIERKTSGGKIIYYRTVIP